MPLINIGELALFRPFDCGRRLTAADQTCPDIVPIQPLEADPILRVEPFGLDHLAFCVRHVIQPAIGKDAIDVHQ